MANAIELTKLKLEALQREASRRRLLPFIQRFNPQYKAGWVHKDICRRLERFSRDVAAQKSPRLMLLMPPRHGKSEIASRNFPAWHLGQYPDHEMIACSYNVALAMTFSRKVKDIISDPLYTPVFPTQLDPNNQGAEAWALQGARGGYVAAGIGGPITGRGAHVLLIDDPVKNAEEADSEDIRNKIWEWYLSTAYSRLAPGGGVLIIQCMTGDTPVLRPDGTASPLSDLRAGDAVMSYSCGQLVPTRVTAVRSNGHDRVLKITTKSGKIVRANGRHPFLTCHEGVLQWARAKHLTTDHTIVAVRDSAVSGRAWAAPLMGANYLRSAEASALPTMASRSGWTGIARHLRTLCRGELPTSSTATALPLSSMVRWFRRKAAAVLSVVSLSLSARRGIGAVLYASTTAMRPGAFAGCSATTATLPSDTRELNALRLPWPNTSDFTTDQVASVELAGVEEVFDLQVEHTENFIANGLVSHNTWWHDDDLAGRLQSLMVNAEDDYVDQFEVVKYPAIAEADEWLNGATEQIEYDLPAPGSGTHSLLRKKGEALHPERYDLDKLLRIKSQNKGGRWWSALYQQNPVPGDGGYFERGQFRLGTPPRKHEANVFIAWDFAISEKKQNDYTVGTVGLQDDNDVLHVVDQVRFKSGDAFFIVESILNLAAKWHNPALVIGFEDGQIYRAVEALLKKRMRERSFYPSTMVLKPITDKLARARALQGRMQQGMVSFTNKPWFETLKLEMLRFPAGMHDDQVDSLAWMAQMVVGRQAPAKPKSAALPSWRDRLTGANASLSHMAS